MHSYNELPQDLPVPLDDGRADHLTGLALPSTPLIGTTATQIDLARLTGRTVLFVYPMTGRPGIPLPEGWDAIPGARGCTPESCGFRDHFAELLDAGARSVLGLSSQPTDHQQEAVERLRLPYELLSDGDFAWADSLRLPTFRTEGRRFHSRLTMIVKDGVIEHVFYPVFPPDAHAGDVLAWLQGNDA